MKKKTWEQSDVEQSIALLLTCLMTCSAILNNQSSSSWHAARMGDFLAAPSPTSCHCCDLERPLTQASDRILHGSAVETKSYTSALWKKKNLIRRTPQSRFIDAESHAGIQLENNRWLWDCTVADREPFGKAESSLHYIRGTETWMLLLKICTSCWEWTACMRDTATASYLVRESMKT